MVITFTCQKESVQFKEETKKLLKKHHALLWMKLLDREWENRLYHWQDLVDIKALVLVNF